MSSESKHEAAEEELRELHEEEDEQVLERESLETELMDEGRSDLGREIDGVEKDEKR